MLFWYLSIGILFIIVILLVFNELTIHFGVHRSPEMKQLETTFFLLKKFRVYRKIIKLKEPFIKSEEDYRDYVARKIEKGIEIIFNSFESIATYNSILKKINHRISKGYKTGKFEVSTIIGTGDAASTALLTGCIWALLGNLRIQKDYQYIFKNLNFSVYPDFKKKVFAVDMNCIFSIKIVYIIYVLKLIGHIFKAEKHKVQTSKEVLKKENLLETG